ncbi:MAG TPA: hypothetical protein VEI02_05565, partial [Planctomycetota bacterium]|nr:hypothetical protein [Planctomycetota bacterium]
FVRRTAPKDATVELLAETPPDLFPPVDGYDAVMLPFGSDAPRLRKLAKGGAVVLAGPGDIELAHSVDERIGVGELVDGARLFRALALRFLAERTP